MNKLFFKFLLVFWTAVVAVLFGMIGISMGLRSIESVPTLESATEDLTTRVDQISRLLYGGDVAGTARYLTRLRAKKLQPEIFVVDSYGRELLERPLSFEDRQFGQNPGTQDAPFSQTITGPLGERYSVFINEHEAGRIMYRTRVQLSWRYPFIAFLIVGLFFSFFLAWYWGVPLRDLQWAVTNVRDGRLSTRVIPRMGRRRDEMYKLGAEFDLMTQKLETLINAQRRLLHDVSHELRSPLARLEIAVELALRRHGQLLIPELNRISREAERVNTLVGELLLLARLENGIDVPRKERVDLLEIITAIADDANYEAEARNCKVVLICEGTFVIDVCADILYRAYENVIRNAVKYTHDGTQVEVSATSNGDTLTVSVSDHGPGLEIDQLRSIFEPFRRFELDPNVSGFGLGLAIAKQSIEMHGGIILAERNIHGGLIFTLTLSR